MDNIIKSICRWLYHQAVARRNLFRLGDRRAFMPILTRTLLRAAEEWGGLFSWKPKSIIDVGAYNGDTALQFSQLFNPEFIALVEPNPEMVKELRKKSFAARQMIFPCALGRREGKAALNFYSQADSNSLLQIRDESSIRYAYTTRKIGETEVPVRTLNGIVKECGLEKLDFLKLNIEGYELETLMGGMEVLSKIKLISVETMFFERYKGQPLFVHIYDFLHNAGFELIGTFRYSLGVGGSPLQCHSLFINNAMIKSLKKGAKI